MKPMSMISSSPHGNKSQEIMTDVEAMTMFMHYLFRVHSDEEKICGKSTEELVFILDNISSGLFQNQQV
jgi:hypothetical protein